MKQKFIIGMSSIIMLAIIMFVGRDYCWAQDMLPTDNGLATYHNSPRYRESESHPLRIVAYVVHPIGWLAREAIFRPLSYLASSNEVTRSITGYREPFDYRSPECFSADDSVPDCRAIQPFNYDTPSETISMGGEEGEEGSLMPAEEREMFFPDINFDFNKRTLNDLGKGQVHKLADLIKKSGQVHVVLEGHTDYRGTDGYNEKLGMDRAEAVRQELVSVGVSGDLLSTLSFGKSKPLFTEEEDWARAINRRVEVHRASNSEGNGGNVGNGDTEKAPPPPAIPE